MITAIDRYCAHHHNAPRRLIPSLKVWTENYDTLYTSHICYISAKVGSFSTTPTMASVRYQHCRRYRNSNIIAHAMISMYTIGFFYRSMINIRSVYLASMSSYYEQSPCRWLLLCTHLMMIVVVYAPLHFPCCAELFRSIGEHHGRT